MNQFVLNPVDLKVKSRLADKMLLVGRKNPAFKVLNEAMGMDLVLKEKKNYVLVTGSSVFVAQLKNDYCGFSVMEDDTMPLFYYTMYHRRNLSIPRIPAQAIDVLRTEAKFMEQILRDGSNIISSFRLKHRTTVFWTCRPKPSKGTVLILFHRLD